MQQSRIDPVEVQLNLPVYDGMGTFETQGIVSYHVSLPKSAQPLIQLNQIMDLYDVIFVRMTTPPQNLELKNPNGDVLKLSFTVPDFRLQGRERINLFLWHNNDDVRDHIQAREIMRNCPGGNMAALTQPAKCGNGVLTFHI